MKTTFFARVGVLVVLLATAPTVGLAVNVTITAGAGTSGAGNEVQTQATNDAPVGILGLLIIDTENDGIGEFDFGGGQRRLEPGAFTLDSFFNGSDDFIAGRSTSVVAFGVSTIGFSFEGANNAGLDQGDPFYIAWFPSLSFTSTNFSAGDWYGYTGFNLTNSWVLPSDGGAVTVGALRAGPAIFQVTAIPEPSTYALIVLGLAVVGGLRFRRKE